MVKIKIPFLSLKCWKLYILVCVCVYLCFYLLFEMKNVAWLSVLSAPLNRLNCRSLPLLGFSFTRQFSCVCGELCECMQCHRQAFKLCNPNTICAIIVNSFYGKGYFLYFRQMSFEAAAAAAAAKTAKWARMKWLPTRPIHSLFLRPGSDSPLP